MWEEVRPGRPDLLVVSALPIFPGRLQPSIFGASELNFCVRDGNRWTLTAINTDFVRTSSISLTSAWRPRLAHFAVLPLPREPACAGLRSDGGTKYILTDHSAKINMKLLQRKNGDPWESRTPVCGVRGRRLDHLTNGPWCAFGDSNPGPTD